jgi:hypothetical protein
MRLWRHFMGLSNMQGRVHESRCLRLCDQHSIHDGDAILDFWLVGPRDSEVTVSRSDDRLRCQPAADKIVGLTEL